MKRRKWIQRNYEQRGKEWKSELWKEKRYDLRDFLAISGSQDSVHEGTYTKSVKKNNGAFISQALSSQSD